MKKKQSKIKINSKKIDTLNSNKSNTALIKMENKSINLINNNNDIKIIENKSKVENNKNIRNILIKNNNRKIYRISFNDYEMNDLDYQDALKFDKRAYFEYYLSLLKTKHMLLFSFVTNDYNSLTIKISLFFFSFALYYTINALFINVKTVHNIYVDKGKYIFGNQIKKILYSNLISTTINFLINKLSLSEENVITIKNIINRKNYGKNLSKLKKYLLIKFILYYILSFIFLSFFWFYVSCFCIVYKNTQLFLIKDTSISFILSLTYPFVLYLLPGFLRIPALRDKKNNKQYMYKIGKLLQLI